MFVTTNRNALIVSGVVVGSFLLLHSLAANAVAQTAAVPPDKVVKVPVGQLLEIQE